MANIILKTWAGLKLILCRSKGNSDVELNQGINSDVPNQDVVKPHAATDVITWYNSSNSGGGSTESVLQACASMSSGEIIRQLQSDVEGITHATAAEHLKLIGPNVLSIKKPPIWWMVLLSVLPNPFNVLLVLIAILSVATPNLSWSAFVLLMIMILISCAVRFWQEYRSNLAAIKLQAAVSSNVHVRRRVEGTSSEDITIDEKDLVPGDILLIDPVSQSSLTGESAGQRKICTPQGEKQVGALFEREKICFMGTSIISGSAVAVVLRTGDDVFIARIMKQLNKARPLNSFRRGIRQVSYLMIGFMLVMVPVVFAISGKITGNWDKLLFSVSPWQSVLSPRCCLPFSMQILLVGRSISPKKKAIVKRLDSIQNIGAMNILWSDKTGTLTKDEVALCHHVDPSGNEKDKIFQLAYINAINQSGKKNSIDMAVLACAKEKTHGDAMTMGQKVAEIPFNFEARRSSCLIKTPTKKLLLICKGVFEEVLGLCITIRHDGRVIDLDLTHRRALSEKVANYNSEGYRVILVATKEVFEDELEDDDRLESLDSNMTVEGLLTFFDLRKMMPPYLSSASKMLVLISAS